MALPNVFRAVAVGGDEEMAEAAAASELPYKWGPQHSPHLSLEEWLLLQSHMASMRPDAFGRSRGREARLSTSPDSTPSHLLRLPPITPGNPYFFYNRDGPPRGRMPPRRRESLPPLLSVIPDLDSAREQAYVGQSRTANVLPFQQLHTRETLPENRHANAYAYAMQNIPPPASQPRPATPRMACSVCFEQRRQGELVILHQCKCLFCLSCLNMAFRVGCMDQGSFPPKCHGFPLRISALGSVLEPDVVERYKQIEAEFSANRPFYCAVLRCSTFIPENDCLMQQEVGICPQCHKSTCKQCRRLKDSHPYWNVDIEKRACPAQEEDVTKLYELGAEKEWKRCPTCGNMVEKVEGCEHMDCVCGVEFCYLCGTHFDENSRCGCNDDDADDDDYDDDDDDDDDEDGADYEDDDEDHDDEDENRIVEQKPNSIPARGRRRHATPGTHLPKELEGGSIMGVL